MTYGPLHIAGVGSLQSSELLHEARINLVRLIRFLFVWALSFYSTGWPIVLNSLFRWRKKVFALETGNSDVLMNCNYRIVRLMIMITFLCKV